MLLSGYTLLELSLLGARGYRETPLSNRSTAQTLWTPEAPAGVGSQPQSQVPDRLLASPAAFMAEGVRARGQGTGVEATVSSISIFAVAPFKFSHQSFIQSAWGRAWQQAHRNKRKAQLNYSALNQRARNSQADHNTNRHETQECSMDTIVLVSYGAPVAFSAPGVRAPEQAWGLGRRCQPRCPGSWWTRSATHGDL